MSDKVLQGRAVLLPQAVSVFLKKYCNTRPNTDDLNLDLETEKIKFSSRWLFKN